MNNNPAKKFPFPFFIILLIGLGIGLGLSWVVFSTPPPTGIPNRDGLSPSLAAKLSTSQAATISPSVVEVGKPAPDFSLKNLDGKEVRLSDFTGKPVMINLWASWCIPCQDEMPAIEKIYEDNKGSGLIVLGINITQQDHIQDVKNTVEKYKLSYPVLLDESGQVSGLYHMYGIPTSYFIDSSVILRRIQIGQILPENMDSYFSEILIHK